MSKTTELPTFSAGLRCIGKLAMLDDKMRRGEIQRKCGLLVAVGLLVGFPGLAKADVKSTFHTIDVPLCGPLNKDPCQTRVYGNSTNAIVGDFDDNDGKTHGFVLRGGEYKLIDEPDAAFCPKGPVSGTTINGINARGDLVGTYADVSCTTGHAFFLSGNSFTPLDPVGVRSQGGFINAQGQVVGTYRTNDQKRHGFVWQRGSFTSLLINVCLAPPCPNDDPIAGTVLYGINDPGQMVGTFLDTGGNRHGFFRDSAGRYTTLDAPGAIFSVAEGINNRGEIVGWYLDGGGQQRGFILSGVGGAWTTISVLPDTTTRVNSINAAGQIAGQYDDESGVTHGFIGTPE
jgi:probable HAF family extracellular repeat protein